MANEIANYSQVALKSLEQFREKWLPILQKHLTKIQAIETELLSEPPSNAGADGDIADEQTTSSGSSTATASNNLSVTGQYIIEENLAKLKKLLHEMTLEHRRIHSSVSKCGKELDRNFKVELRDIIKNEKEIEAHTPYFSQVNTLIFEHLMSLGRVDVAETFMKESELEMSMPSKCNKELMRSIMEPFQCANYLPAIKWIEENSPANKLLLYRLHQQHALQILGEGKKIEALDYVKKQMQPLGTNFPSEIKALLTVIISYPKVPEKHKNLFMEGNWLELEEELSAELTRFKSPLSMILDVGARAIPLLLKYQLLLRKDTNQMWFGDELPIEVPIPEHVHSTFTCPILKVQTTKDNPPMRLNCGHLISREALSRLTQGGRINRLKCPYCPEESSIGDAVEVVF